MESKKQGTYVIFVFLIIVVFAVIAVVFVALLQNNSVSNTPEDNENITQKEYVNDGEMILSIVSETESEVVIGLSFSSTENISASGVVLNFDVNALNSVQITEDSSTLSLNKLSDNENGVATIDIARIGGLSFEKNVNYVEFRFSKVLGYTGETTINVDDSSVLGVPNVVAPDGFGSIVVTL